MPQTSPMNWILISITPLTLMKILIVMSKTLSSSMMKKFKKENKTKKWTW